MDSNSPQWLKKIEESLGSDSNPTKLSLLGMLSNAAEQLKAYKALGSIEELRRYKEIAKKMEEV
jgi:hypothetical protein